MDPSRSPYVSKYLLYLIISMTIISTQAYSFGWPTKYKTNLEKSSNEVESAVCRSESWPSLSEMRNYVLSQSFKPRDFSNNSFSGMSVTLRDESPYLIKRFKSLVHSGVKISNKDCESVSCLNKEIFQEERGILYLYMLMKYKLNFSDLSHSKNSTLNRWGPSDLNLFKKVLNPLPENLFKGRSEYKIFKNFFTGSTHALPKRIYGKLDPGNKALTFFSDWSRLGKRNQKEYIIFHELSHIIDEKHGGLSNSKEWISFSRWGLKRGKLEWKAGKKNNLISDYASVAPSEDFAESLYAYRYIPDKLKLVSPKKYNFIKEKVFKGLTFESKNSCYSPLLADKPTELARRLFTAQCYYRGDRFERRDQEAFDACLIYHDQK